MEYLIFFFKNVKTETDRFISPCRALYIATLSELLLSMNLALVPEICLMKMVRNISSAAAAANRIINKVGSCQFVEARYDSFQAFKTRSGNRNSNSPRDFHCKITHNGLISQEKVRVELNDDISSIKYNKNSGPYSNTTNLGYMVFIKFISSLYLS